MATTHWDYAIFFSMFFGCFVFLSLVKGCWKLIYYQMEADAVNSKTKLKQMRRNAQKQVDELVKTQSGGKEHQS
eukprot:SAG22_NODE_572_length_9005_cov_105.428138_2_plen_74_part_00